MTISDEVRQLAHIYVRHGGKDNRRQQVARLVKACAWIVEHHHVHRVAEIGKRQIIDFYRNHREMSPRTTMGYFYAFCELWTWLGRPSEPPRPLVTVVPKQIKNGNSSRSNGDEECAF